MVILCPPAQRGSGAYSCVTSQINFIIRLNRHQGQARYVISHYLRRSCMLRRSRTVAVIVLSVAAAATVGAQNTPSAGDRLDTLKTEVAAKVDARAKLAQEMVDSVFSFGELGFQEFEIGRAHVSTPVTVKSRM